MRSSFRSPSGSQSGGSSNGAGGASSRSSKNSRSPPDSEHRQQHQNNGTNNHTLLPRFHHNGTPSQNGQESSLPFRPSSYAQQSSLLPQSSSQVSRTSSVKKFNTNVNAGTPTSTSTSSLPSLLPSAPLNDVRSNISQTTDQKIPSRSNSNNNSPIDKGKNGDNARVVGFGGGRSSGDVDKGLGDCGQQGSATSTSSSAGDVPIPISAPEEDPSKFKNFVRGKSEAELIAAFKGMDFMIRTCSKSEREAKENQKKLRSEMNYWIKRCEEMEKIAMEEKAAQLEQDREQPVLVVQKNHSIIIQSSIVQDDDEGEGGGKNEASVKVRKIEESEPIVSGLPPTSRFPGKAPPLPTSVKAKAKPKKGLFGMPNLTEMLMKRVQTGKDDQPKKPALLKPKRPLHNRLQFYWVGQAQGSPRGVSQSNVVPDLVSSSGNTLNEQLPLNSDPEAIARSVELQSRQRQVQLSDSLSVYAAISPTEMIDILKDERIVETFTKNKPSEIVKKSNPIVSESPENTKRPSVLGPAASQKYHITVRCFSKAFDGWEGFKQAILQCRLEISHINLLLETIPDPEASQGSRRLQEWEELVEKVQQLRRDHPSEEMYEDEAFVHYISTIPNLHQRLQCMNVMNSFDHLLARFRSDIDLVMDGIEILLKNKSIPKLFHAILSVGNYLNEDTNIANKRWFRLGSLRRVAEFKGVGRGAKSLMYFLAFHLGPILTSEESNILQKAAQVSIVQILHNVLNIVDIFKLLTEQTEDTSTKSIMSKKRRNSILPGQDDSNDRFAEVGREFIHSNKLNFIELKEDLKRLLQDYHLCCQYFGDVESFIPVDRKVDDERNPGQQRFVPDLISVFCEFFNSYRTSLKEVEGEREKERLEARKEKKQQQGLATVATCLADHTKATTSTVFPSARQSENLEPLLKDGTFEFLKPTTTSKPQQALASAKEIVPAALASPQLSDKASMKDGQGDNRERGSSSTLGESFDRLKHDSSYEIKSKTTNSGDNSLLSSTVNSQPSSFSSIPYTAELSIPVTPVAPIQVTHSQLMAETPDQSILANELETYTKPLRRASLRPSLFSNGPPTVSLTQKVDSTVLRDLDALKQLNETEDSRSDKSLNNNDSPRSKFASIENSNTIIVNENKDSSSIPPISNILATIKRRESLRAINGIVHNMAKEEASATPSMPFAVGGGFKSSQFKFFDENNPPPFPGAKPLPGLTSGTTDFDQLRQRRQFQPRFGSHLNPPQNIKDKPNRPTSSRSGLLASLPECSQESETPPSSPFPPKSASRNKPDSHRQFISPSPLSSSQQSFRRPHSATTPSRGVLDHGTPPSSQIHHQSPSNFTRPTSASTARTSANSKQSREETLERIRNTILKDQQ